MNSLPNYIKHVDGLSRQRFYAGKWILTQQSNGKTSLNFSAISFDKTSIPIFIKDQVVQYVLIK